MATETLLPGDHDDDIVIVDSDYIRKLHTNILTTGSVDASLYEARITQTLGGIDQILQHYLKEQLLDPIQLQSIHSTLTSSTDNTMILSNESFMVEHHLPIFGTIVLQTKNTFIHQLCTMQRAEEIIYILYHKITACFILITLLYHNICVALEYYSTVSWFRSTAYLASELIVDIVAVSYIFCILLTVNKTAVKFSLSTFEFWLKFLTAMILGTCTYLFDAMSTDATALQKITHRACFAQVWVAVTLYSVMDGLNLTRWIKGVLAIGFAVYISVFAIYYTLFEQTDHIIVLWSGCEISLLHMIASTNRILSIFLWRQAILFIWKKNKATIISTWIDIKWITSNTQQTCTIDIN